MILPIVFSQLVWHVRRQEVERRNGLVDVARGGLIIGDVGTYAIGKSWPQRSSRPDLCRRQEEEAGLIDPLDPVRCPPPLTEGDRVFVAFAMTAG